MKHYMDRGDKSCVICAPEERTQYTYSRTWISSPASDHDQESSIDMTGFSTMEKTYSTIARVTKRKNNLETSGIMGSLLLVESEQWFDGIDGILVDERLIKLLKKRLKFLRGSNVSKIRIGPNSLKKPWRYIRIVSGSFNLNYRNYPTYYLKIFKSCFHGILESWETSLYLYINNEKNQQSSGGLYKIQ